MRTSANKKLEVLRGRLTDLYVEDGQEDFVSTQGTNFQTAGAAIGLAAAGLAGAATNALFSAGGGADRVKYFTGLLDGKRIAGQFSKIWFSDGDHLECAVESQPDGSYTAYAVRRPSDQTLWMFPHCSRGRKKHWRYARRMSAILSFLMTIFLLLCLTPVLGIALFADDAARFLSTIFVVIGVLMGTYFSLNTARRWRLFVEIAESIFEAYGYPDPSQVDMPEQNKLYWKKFPISPEPREHGAWVFRYLK